MDTGGISFQIPDDIAKLDGDGWYILNTIWSKKHAFLLL